MIVTTPPTTLQQHPLAPGELVSSPGGQFTYRIVGACCVLYDRNELPWPCCSLAWKGKQPSWRRVGRRYIPDIAAKGHPCYVVEMLGNPGRTFVKPFYWISLGEPLLSWWYTRMTPGVKQSQAEVSE